ncbi:hypothetical protein BBK36DRAFT_1197311 [Trichoderma citrinoviride]|uniref:Uncharacterized protein n=1 Tax=Trichoderma citrinoviride TaxID=58853 RepID=A0A2T4BE65_9HYPO|nr:hypothetical protein BBK36DRAFT_1197311 [Trichoderma citrinoviride]PTB67623.1 hypothetical protein BBK36DRAFT_1197311 [Trichoderma citrinoviride]
MHRVSLLTSSRLEPTGGFRPHSTTVHVPSSFFVYSHYCLQVYEYTVSVPVHVVYNNIISRALLVTASSRAGKQQQQQHHLLSHALLFASQQLLTHGSAMFAKTVVDFWQSRRIQKIRAKLFYEFAVFILGCGNAFFLLVFWPGWLFLGAAALALRQLAG